MQRLCTLDQNLTYNANILFSSVVANIGTAMPDYHISDPCPNYYSDIAGFRVPLPTLNFDPNFGITAQQNILQTFRQNYANEETFYFHGNHLGSANWVTLQNASPTQFLLHLPYGEEFVKQLSGSYDERFTFTGKEKDIETGYYYFGARFDNVDLGFISVDPMSDKYPSISPYAYCAWNPVKLVDPEGMEAIENDDWYKNNKGEMRWFNSTDETYTHNGEIYKRHGQTAKMTNSDGDFVYGDQYGHTHNSAPLREVKVTKKLTDFERTMRNPLVQRIHQSAADFWGNPVTIGTIVGIGAIIGISELAFAINSGALLSESVAVTSETSSSAIIKKLESEAQLRYPLKAGKTELHHIVPKYLGGDPKGTVTHINGAYHQVITNEFRHLYPYGQPPPASEQLKIILESVYNKYPLP